MKTLTVLLGLIYVLQAQAQFGVSRTETSDLACNLYRSIGRLENGLLLYPCVTGKKEAYSIAFAGVSMSPSAAARLGSDLVLKLHCTVGQPKGAFLFGGETIGYETSYSSRQQFFYAAGEGNYGRCYLTADRALLSQFKPKVNTSGILLIPVKATPGAVAR